MNPVGIALAFLVFWSLVAAGVFLTVSSGNRLRRVAVRQHGEVIHVDTAAGVALVLHVVTLVIGLAMIFAGVYATYVVVLAR